MLIPEIPLDRQCQIIEYNKIGIYGIHKASGVLSHPNAKTKGNGKPHTLLQAKYYADEEYYEWIDHGGHQQKLYLCHRLDSPTSGVIIGASNSELASLIKLEFANRKIEKTYLAITECNPKIKEGIWTDFLVEEKINGKLRVSRGKGSKCQTKVRFLQRKKGVSSLQLVELKPLTGRTHQLRVQCMLRKMPIVGDKTYGNFALNRRVKKDSKLERLCLHASEISFSINYKNNRVVFYSESPLPRILGKIFS